ncbi:Predicted PurR-regulated permease PerM [Modicisalibacter ilicicola DSM 19980]|uniref:Predicted PurR-regulated permease PerM n=1 Tax=Modicisalibacter ilicicola DSM 19980 TaxID=1121942 RepID=A0A1M4Y6X8_9GAMM|nr:AI-2E family transporter [Halomonas ilicicola]SHF01430.1 Predicted PurR-regulated permease PerM [Halomonas ilicicola DSM 19980]
MPEASEGRSSDYSRRVWIAVGAGTTMAVLLIGLWFSLGVLLMVFAGLLLATLFSLPANWLHRHTFLSRRLSLVIVLVTSVMALITFGLNFALNLGQQFERLAEVLPGSIEGLEGWARGHPMGAWMADRVEQIPPPSEALGSWSSRISSMFSTTLDALLNLLVVLLIGLFIAFEPDLYKRGVLRLIVPARRHAVADFLRLVERKMAWWLLGRLVSMTIIGLLSGGGLWLLGIPMAFSLGLLAGLLSFIPYLGPLLSAVPALLVAFSQDPTSMLHVAVLYLGIQFLESYLVTPLVQREAVSIPPGLLLVVQLWLGLYVGLLGLLLAEPLIVLGMLAVRRFYVEGWLEKRAMSRERQPEEGG